MSFDVGALVGSIIEPAAQATATISILNHQKGLYDDIAEDRIRLIDESVDHFIHLLRIQMGFTDKIDKKWNDDENRFEYHFDKGPYDQTKDNFKEAFGRKPKPAPFVPPVTADIGRETAEDSLKAVPAAQRYMEASNRIMEQDSLVRALVMDGRYVCVEDVTSCTISDMINGHLPVGDVIEIIKDGAERAAMQGRIGNTHALTLRDLGISRLRSKMTGINLHFQHLQSLNQNVHRVGDRVAISDFMQRPEQRLGFSLALAQLVQSSLQNEYNIDAAGSPWEMGKLQAKMQEMVMLLGTEAQRGNMINQFVPNYAALLAPAVESITQALVKPLSGDYSTTPHTAAGVAGPAPAPQQQPPVVYSSAKDAQVTVEK